MLKALNHTRVLRYAGLFTWAMAAVPLLYTQWIPFEGSKHSFWAEMGWLSLSYTGFGICYYWLTQHMDQYRIRWYKQLLLLLMTACALTVSYLNGSGLGSILLMVAAGVIPWLLPLRIGVTWLLLSQLAVLPVYYLIMGFSFFEALMQSLLYGGFSVLVFVTSLVARQQTQQSQQQQQLNIELHATRALLAESSRLNERTRISRELHDLLGHHLTVLSLNLEVATHLTQGQAQEHVKQSQTLAKLLLTDVREVVSQLREQATIDFSATLKPWIEKVFPLKTHLECDPCPFMIEDAQQAHILLRCIQEIITNTIRHATAQHLWIKVYRQAGKILLQAKDDGTGVDIILLGNGLRGMQERLNQYHGTLHIQSAPDAGFQLLISIQENYSLMPDPYENDPYKSLKETTK